MIDHGFTESNLEDAALAWLEAVGWQIAHGPDIAPDMPAAERADYAEGILPQCLFGALLPKVISCGLRLKGPEHFIERATT